jgi:SCP-2 sterol transfer family protein
VSSENPQQAQTPQQTTGETTAGREITEFFKQSIATGPQKQPRLRGLRGVCRFDISGAGIWNIAVNDGEVTVIEGAGDALPADCAVTCSAEDFLRVIHRENQMNMVTAAMQGLVAVTGDKVFAFALLGNVIAAPLAASQRL